MERRKKYNYKVGDKVFITDIEGSSNVGNYSILKTIATISEVVEKGEQGNTKRCYSIIEDEGKEWWFDRELTPANESYVLLYKLRKKILKQIK